MDNTTDFDITEIKPEHSRLITSFIAENWGSPVCVSRGRCHNVGELPGFVQLREGQVVGLVTYNINGSDCELVTLNSLLNNSGLGTQLVERVIEIAKTLGCRRVWLITTNDNTAAIRFYQKRGFEWVGFHRNAIDKSRKLKPEIPEFGDDNIPIKHEIEFELAI